jgi:ribosomal protein S18 acetylase RimI-like enzyme
MKNFANIPGFVLRELAPSDIGAFVELGLPTCAFMHGRSQVSAEKMRQNFTGFVREYAFDPDSEIYVVVSSEGAHVAQLWLHSTHNRFNGLSEQWIWDLTVNEAFRRRGIARSLLAFARNRAHEKNCAELWLLVSSLNSEAIRLYQSFGLSMAGHLMRLQLAEPRAPKETVQAQVNTAILRPLEPKDVPSIYRLWSVAGLPYKLNGRDREDLLRRHLAGPTVGGWGVFEGDALVAAALVSCDERKGWIERLATEPAHRGAGLARAIIAAGSQSLRESGALVIAALIESENQASRKLFESCGFVHEPGLCYYSIRDNPGN